MPASSSAVPAPLSRRYAPAPLGSVRIGGELGRRARLSFARLEKYDPALVFQSNGGWPGDREGRAILGQVLIARATRRPSTHVAALVAGLDERLNARGYLGPELPAGVQDEQVLSGHSWLLRGLVEHHMGNPGSASRALLARVADGLFLPARGAYARYPITPQQRPRSDQADQSFTAKKPVQGWRLSTDVGCAFIALDGATAAYEVLRTPALAELIDEMIARFRQLDPLQVGAQTHATLSAARGLLRHAAVAARPDLVAFAETIFATYKAHGMTDHCANTNWFNRPQWTEGCAIIDSYDLAVQLFVATGKARYLEDAQLIYWNGVGFNQRPNGGFGCDTCPGSDGTPILAPFGALFEAPDCCSMRGGEGIARAISHAFLVRPDGVLLPDFHEAEATLPLAGGEVTLRERTAYPFEGKASLEVLRSTSQGVLDLRMALPTWIRRDGVVAKVNGQPVPLDVRDDLAVFRIEAKPGFRVELTFPLSVRSVPAINATRLPDAHGFRHGPLVLGSDAPGGKVPPAAPAAAAGAAPTSHRTAEGAAPLVLPAAAAFVAVGRATYRPTGFPGAGTLKPITGLAFMPLASAKAVRRRILFSNG